MFRKIRITSAALLITGALAAQSSGIKVHIVDKTTKASVPFVQVVVEQGNRQVAGTMTDDKGYAEIKPLDPGTYNVRAQQEGYKDFLYQGVQVNQDALSHIEASMVSVADTSIGVITIMTYKTPLIRPGTTTGGVADSGDIHHMAANDINSIAADVPGVYSSDVGGSLNMRGGRSDATQYIIDGQKVTSDQLQGSVPIGLVDQEQVITGGIPAKYGDVSGGIVEINTIAGADHYFGSVQGSTSNLFNSYDNNDVNFSLGGPIWSKTDSNKNKTTLVDFILGGDYQYQKDHSPSFINPTYVNSATLAQLDANPITPEPGGVGFFSSADYVTNSQMESQTWHQNNAQDQIGINGKLNFHVSSNVKVTVGGSYQYQIGHDFNNYSLPGGGGGIGFSYEMFDAAQNPQETHLNYKGFVRLTQKFYTPEGKDKSSIIKNAYYGIMAEYSHSWSQIDNGNFGNNYFEYGYVGQFNEYRTPFYQFNQNGPAGPGRYLSNYTDSAYSFTPSNLNPIEANYAKDVINQLGNGGYYATVIPENNGVVNGGIPGNIYSLWNNVGAGYPGYFEQNANHFRFSANFDAEIANNSIEIGFEYEQNSISQYSFDPTLLWTLMRQLANFQLQSLDTAHPILVSSGTYNTYNYNYISDAAAQSQFDKSLRQKLGLPVNGTQYIQTDNYAPSEYSLSMFSASDLLNNGSYPFLSYFGYNYLGNLSSTNPSIDDFFNQKDANGNNLYPMGAYQPIYLAGYIQDHFDIKTMVFDVGLRVEQFNANQEQLSDPYLLYPAYTAGTEEARALGSIPSDIGSNYVVYVNNSQSPTSIVGYRNGNNWYNSTGNLVADPTVIASASQSGNIQPYLVNPSQTTISSNAFTSYTPQTEVLPRLAFSFPITDKANFFAHYDILTQRPPGVGVNIFDPIQYLFIQSEIGGILNNPALVPQKTTDYELGFTQVLDQAKSMALEISAFYRDMTNLVEAYRFLDAYPTTYLSFSNIDFGTVKGLSLSYDLRRIGNWSDVKFRAGYNLSFANGTGSSPTSGQNLAASGEPNLQIPAPLNYDQRHTITANLDFHFSSGGNYDGPVWTTHSGKSIQILSNAGINVNFSAGSGTPYTQWINATQQGIGITSKYGIIGTLNGDNLPWQNRVDIKADKMFRLSIKSHPCQITIYIAATNLLNTENVLGVYSYTGSATDDGFLESVQGKQTIAGQVSPQAYVSQYSVYEKSPTNFSLPRQADLGLVFAF